MAKRTKQRPLTAKQEKFCQEYMIDLNATQAAIRAGYASKSINTERLCNIIGPTNLVKISIKAEIQRLKANICERLGIKADDVVKELAKLAFSNIKDYVNVEDDEVYFKDFAEVTDEQTAAVESIKVMKKTIKGKNNDDDVEVQTIQFKLHSKTNTLEQLGKHLGVFEADNSQKGDKTINIINFNKLDAYIDDTKQIISGPAGPARITGSKSV